MFINLRSRRNWHYLPDIYVLLNSFHQFLNLLSEWFHNKKEMRPSARIVVCRLDSSVETVVTS